MEQFVDDVRKIRRKGLSDLRPGVFGSHNPADLDQPDQGAGVPAAQVPPMLFPKRNQLMGRVIDQRRELRPLPFRKRIPINPVDLIPDDARSVVEDVGDRLVFAVEVADKMLGPLRQIEDRLEVDNFCADRLNGWKLLREKSEMLHRAGCAFKRFHIACLLYL